MKLLKRVLLVILVLLVALVVFLAGSIAVDSALDGDRLDDITDQSRCVSRDHDL
jgi:hypothetical protein